MTWNTGIKYVTQWDVTTSPSGRVWHLDGRGNVVQPWDLTNMPEIGGACATVYVFSSERNAKSAAWQYWNAESYKLKDTGVGTTPVMCQHVWSRTLQRPVLLHRMWDGHVFGWFGEAYSSAGDTFNIDLYDFAGDEQKRHWDRSIGDSFDYECNLWLARDVRLRLPRRYDVDTKS